MKFDLTIVRRLFKEVYYSRDGICGDRQCIRHAICAQCSYYGNGRRYTQNGHRPKWMSRTFKIGQHDEFSRFFFLLLV